MNRNIWENTIEKYFKLPNPVLNSAGGLSKDYSLNIFHFFVSLHPQFSSFYHSYGTCEMLNVEWEMKQSVAFQAMDCEAGPIAQPR